MLNKALKRRDVVAWALYDWANSAFATTVMAVFFPVFFRQYWSDGVEATVTTFRLGLANGSASLVVALLAPVLGAIADRGGSRKGFLTVFAMLGVTASAGLYFVPAGGWSAAMAVYVLATVGFSGSIVFYDSLMVDVASPDEYDVVSALGYAFGYLGGGVLLALNVAMSLKPAWFGLADASEAVRWSFLSVAVWWGLFTVPLLRAVRETPTENRASGFDAVAAGFAQLAATLREIRALREVGIFLLAYWLYIDGVHTVIKMAMDYGLSLGFSANSLVLALLVTQFVGFPAAIAFGLIGDRLGARAGLFLALTVYLSVTLWAYRLDSVAEFYAMAMTIGLVQGGVQSLSRSFYARLIPVNKSAEFFGFYNMLGKFAAILGPMLTGVVAVTTGDPRLGILAIALLFIGGAILLSLVNQAAGEADARRLASV